MNSNSSLRDKLYDYIRVADDKKLHAIYSLLENEISETTEWWKDKKFVEDLSNRYDALEKGKDNGFTVEQLKESVNKLRKSAHEK